MPNLGSSNGMAEMTLQDRIAAKVDMMKGFILEFKKSGLFFFFFLFWKFVR